MDPQKNIGFQLRLVTNLIKRQLEQHMRQQNYEKLTRMQGFIIGYLYRNRQRAVFQRDIEAEFSVQRSTVTAMLQVMEKDGLITRSPVEGDKRLKRLQLTPKAVSRHECFEQGVSVLERQMQNGLSQQELEGFFNTLQKIKANLEKEQTL